MELTSNLDKSENTVFKGAECGFLHTGTITNGMWLEVSDFQMSLVSGVINDNIWKKQSSSHESKWDPENKMAKFVYLMLMDIDVRTLIEVSQLTVLDDLDCMNSNIIKSRNKATLRITSLYIHILVKFKIKTKGN